MRTVYHFGPAVFDESKLDHVASIIPEASRFKVTFRRPANDLMSLATHLVEKLEITFRNGSSAVVEGYFLWKFRDSIPPAFGDDQVGFLDENPYGAGHTEDLLNRIKAIHDGVLFRAPTTKADVVNPPVCVDVDCAAGTYRVVQPAALTESTVNLIADGMAKHFMQVRAKVDTFLAETMKVMLDKGKCHYEPRPCKEYPGMLRNTQVFTKWPSSTMDKPVGELLHELCPMDTDHGPTPTLNDRLIDWMKPHADDAIREMVSNQGPADRAIRKELGLTGAGRRRRATTDEVLAGLAVSTTPTLLEDAMYATWMTHRGQIAIRALLGR
jgi:hypothetical protein